MSQVSRLQSGKDICRQVYEQAKHELRDSFDDYTLFWPERKVSLIYHPLSVSLSLTLSLSDPFSLSIYKNQLMFCCNSCGSTMINNWDWLKSRQEHSYNSDQEKHT